MIRSQIKSRPKLPRKGMTNVQYNAAVMTFWHAQLIDWLLPSQRAALLKDIEEVFSFLPANEGTVREVRKLLEHATTALLNSNAMSYWVHKHRKDIIRIAHRSSPHLQ